MAEEALKNIHSLFKESFVENCKLDDDEVNEVELETLETLEPEEIFDNLKELLTSLISFKKSIRNPEIKELTQRLVIFEKLIQKLESDIRSHISVQHQMRLEIETFEFKVEELQKLKKYHVKKIEELDKMLVDKESEILHINNKNALELEIKLKAIENKFKHEICSTMELYRRESGSNGRDKKSSKGFCVGIDVEKKNEDFGFKDQMTGRNRKTRLPKVIKASLDDRSKRTKKQGSFRNELLKTIENGQKKDKKYESPYLRREISHFRSASDLGITQRSKLTLM